MRVVELPRSNWVPSSIAARERSKRSRGRSTSLANRGCSSPRSRRPWCLTTEACKRARVVASIGVNERDGETLYNTQLLFDAD